MIPCQLEYDTQRRDRPGNPHGGVLIAAKKFLQLGDIKASSGIEHLSAPVKVDKSKIQVEPTIDPQIRLMRPTLTQ